MNIADKIKDRRIYASADDSETAQPVEMESDEGQSEPEEYQSPIGEGHELSEPLQAEVQQKDEPHVPAKPEDSAGTQSPDPEYVCHQDGLQAKLRLEVENIAMYVTNKGLVVPEGVSELLTSDHVDDLLTAHGQLCQQIKPATPESIVYLNRHLSKKGYLFSPIPLVRNFIIIAILFIVSMLGVGLSADVNAEVLSKGILHNSGWPLLKNLIFICSGAGIGTVFNLLSRLTREIEDATLNKSDTTYYWAMLIMGILSGLIMSEIIVVNHQGLEDSVEMNRLIFALLGGFSSEVVYTILQGMMNKVRSLLI